MPISTLLGKKKTGVALPTKAPLAPVTAFGQPITSPVPVNSAIDISDPAKFSGSIQNYLNQANAANSQRYNEGLGVLTGGYNTQQGFIGNALSASQGIGKQAYDRIGMAEQNAAGKTQQSAVSRGLGNTTIVDSLQRGVQRDAEDARQGVDEQIANRQIGLNLQQANAASQGSGNIANWIGARNDVGPDLGFFASLMQQSQANKPVDLSGSKQTVVKQVAPIGGQGSTGGMTSAVTGSNSGFSTGGGSGGGGSGSISQALSGGGTGANGGLGSCFKAADGTVTCPGGGPVQAGIQPPKPKVYGSGPGAYVSKY